MAGADGGACGRVSRRNRLRLQLCNRNLRLQLCNRSLRLAHFYRVKISASPATAKAAPHQLRALGRCPVRSHISGRMITGDVADKVAMIPVFDHY